MKKIFVVLNAGFGELERITLDLDADDDSYEASTRIHEAIGRWLLSPGDTITITEG